MASEKKGAYKQSVNTARRTWLEVLGELDHVLWKESRHEARQNVAGASVIKVLILPEMSSSEQRRA